MLSRMIARVSVASGSYSPFEERCFLFGVLNVS